MPINPDAGMWHCLGAKTCCNNRTETVTVLHLFLRHVWVLPVVSVGSCNPFFMPLTICCSVLLLEPVTGSLATLLTHNNVLRVPDTGVTYSWDFSKAEEKEQEVQAAKAARGRARQQKAKKHTQRLHQQREKAATTLARLTALQPDTNAEIIEESGNDDAAAAAYSCQSSTAALHYAVGKADPELAEKSHHQQHLENGAGVQQGIGHNQHAGHESLQGCHLTGAHSMPTAPSSGTMAAIRQAPNMSGGESENIGGAPLRRLASVAGYPSRQMNVPGPLLHSCAVESRRGSPSSMQSWQIVRARPVQSEKATVRRPSHVKVQS